MTPHEATRTLVKSPPEVWAQCSDAEALDRHLNGSFGEIRITRLEPETAVAWEGEKVRGTVRIEPSAWGTRVTLTAQVEEAPPQQEAAPQQEAPPQPEAQLEPAAPPEPEAPPEPVAVEVYESPPTHHPAVGPPPAAEVEAEEIPEPEAAAEPPEPGVIAEPREPEGAEAPAGADEPPAPERPPGFWARLTRRFRAARPEPEEEPIAPQPEPEPEPEAVAAEPEPEPEPEPVASEPEPVPEPELEPVLVPEPEPPAPPPVAEAPEPPTSPVDLAPPEASAPSRPDPAEVLSAALDSLGQAHHRPFSRA